MLQLYKHTEWLGWRKKDPRFEPSKKLIAYSDDSQKLRDMVYEINQEYSWLLAETFQVSSRIPDKRNEYEEWYEITEVPDDLFV